MALSWRPLTTYQITGHIVARALMVHCRIPSHLLQRFFPKTFAPFKTKNFQLKDEFLMNFFFFFPEQASNGINGRGERNGRDVTQVGSEFWNFWTSAVRVSG
jgi:hypothetical protein